MKGILTRLSNGFKLPDWYNDANNILGFFKVDILTDDELYYKCLLDIVSIKNRSFLFSYAVFIDLKDINRYFILDIYNKDFKRQFQENIKKIFNRRKHKNIIFYHYPDLCEPVRCIKNMYPSSEFYLQGVFRLYELKYLIEP